MKVNAYNVSTVEEITKKLDEIVETLPNPNCSYLYARDEFDIQNTITVLVTFTFHESATIRASISSGRQGFDYSKGPSLGSWKREELEIECSGPLKDDFNRPLSKDEPIQRHKWDADGKKRNVLAEASIEAQLPTGTSETFFKDIAKIFNDRIERIPTPMNKLTCCIIS